MSDERADQRNVQDSAADNARTAVQEQAGSIAAAARRVLANPRRTRR